jgi:large subunit ribosomal protein L23
MTAEKKIEDKAAKKAPRLTERMCGVLLHPVITEKSSQVAGQNKIVFAIRRDATKKDVKAAVEVIDKVEVASVNVAMKPGKEKRFKGIKGSTSALKKAYVTLAEGHSIDIMSGVK